MRALLALLLCGCGRWSFDPIASDASTTQPPVAIQRGTTTLAIGQPAATVQIGPVDLNHALLLVSTSAVTLDPQEGLVLAELTNATIQLSRSSGTTAVTVSWQVIEAPTVFEVQRATFRRLTTDIQDAETPIASIDLARSFCVHTMLHDGTGYDEDDYLRTRLTANTLQFHIGLPPTGGGSLPELVAYQVVSLADAVVEHGVLELAPGTPSPSTALANFDLEHSVSWLSNSTNADQGDVGSLALRPLIQLAQLTITREVTALDTSIAWSLVTSPAFHVTSMETTLAAGESTRTTPIPQLDLDRAFVVVTGATTPYGTSAGDRVGIAWVRAVLEPGAVTVTRDDTLDATTVTWSIVEL